MADNRSQNADNMSPIPEGHLLNEIILHNPLDDEYTDSENSHNDRLNDIEPRLEESFSDQVRFMFEDDVNSMVRWIVNDIHIPKDSKAVWKRINMLRLNSECSPINTGLLRSVNALERFIEALSRHFNATGLRNRLEISYGRVERQETLNLCRELVKLLELLGFNTERPSLSETLCGIMRTVYFEGGDKKDMGNIVRILHDMLYDVRMPLFDAYYDVIYHHLLNQLALSNELSLCADITNRFLLLSYDYPSLTVYPLCKALRTLVSRIYEGIEKNEEYGDQCAALENVMKVLCRLCHKYGLETVLYMSRVECGVLGQVRKILKHALLHPRPGAKSFKGKHLLYALRMAKYIYDKPSGKYLAGHQDVKVVLDFAMSDLPSRYLFDGRRRLKHLADVMVSTVLNSHCAEYVLDNWSSI